MKSTWVDLAKLTPAEMEVGRHLSNGLTAKEIAHDFGISSKTVENHRAHIYMKLGTNSLVKMSQLFWQHDRLIDSGVPGVHVLPPYRRAAPVLVVRKKYEDL